MAKINNNYWLKIKIVTELNILRRLSVVDSDVTTKHNNEQTG